MLSGVPNVGEGGRQISDERSTKERRATESCRVPFLLCMSVF